MTAIAAMPYPPAPGGLLEEQREMGEEVTLEALAEYLEAKVVVETEVRRDEAANEKELSQVRSDIECARRVWRLISAPPEVVD